MNKNIQYLTKFGPKKCPECKNTCYYDQYDSLNCDNCNITIYSNSFKIDKEEYNSFDDFKYHYQINRFYPACETEISSFVNYNTGLTRICITDNNECIMLDTSFQSKNMTLLQIYKHSKRLFKKMKKLSAFL